MSRRLLNGMKMLWYSVFSFSFFCLAPPMRKSISMRTTSVTAMVIFQKCHGESYLITSLFKVRSQQLRAILRAAFWKMTNSLRFYSHGSTYMLILSWIMILKRILTKVLESCPKILACASKNISATLFLYASFSVQQT